MFEYVKDNYGVDVQIGQVIYLSGERGKIAEDRGHYLGINFDKDKPGVISNVHPTDDGLFITCHIKDLRKMTRSQSNYQDYLRADCNETFAEWMGFN